MKEIVLVAGGDSAGFNLAHIMDVLVQGAGEAKYIVVTNRADNSVSIINATDNLIKQTVPVGPTPGGVMIYHPGAAAAGNQATS
jgi:YVTN family beta-propeller protein